MAGLGEKAPAERVWELNKVPSSSDPRKDLDGSLATLASRQTESARLSRFRVFNRI